MVNSEQDINAIPSFLNLFLLLRSILFPVYRSIFAIFVKWGLETSTDHRTFKTGLV
jgi:hypothetical protein